MWRLLRFRPSLTEKHWVDRFGSCWKSEGPMRELMAKVRTASRDAFRVSQRERG